MSSRGVAGTTKPRSHNVNSVYSGRSNASGRAAGPLKHGIQPLGKSAGIIRRMPPPATLPSLKAEHGQDVSVNLVPQGGQGWNKPVDANTDGKASGSPDLRPNWAKSVAGGNPTPNAEAAGNSAVAAAPQPQRQKNAVNNNREFPPLAATVTATSKQAAAAPVTDKSQRVQNASEPVPVIPVPPPPSSGSGYIGASSSARNNVDRMLPERYYGGGQEIRQTTQRRYDFRQKMAQLSMESKEAAAQQTEKSPPEVEPIVETDVIPVTSAPIAQPQNPSPLPSPTPTSASARRAPNEATRSQDVRMYYQPSSLSSATAQEAPPESEGNWNRSGSSYEGDYLGGSRGNDFSHSGGYHPPQPLHGRVESGGSFGNMGVPMRMPSRTGIPPLRYDYDVEPNIIHPPNFGSWEDPYNAQWGADPARFGTGNARLSQRSRGGYRGDSRGNSESESGWYPPPTQRRNDPNGWGYPMDPQMTRYDGYPSGRGSNRSRTTSNSYPDDFDPAMYVYTENDRRVKRRPDEDLRYDTEIAEGYDRQKVGI